MGQKTIGKKAHMAFRAVLWYTGYSLKREIRAKRLIVRISAASLLPLGCKAAVRRRRKATIVRAAVRDIVSEG